MNLAVISSLASLFKGGAFIATTLQDVVKSNIEIVDDLDDVQILGLVSKTLFTILDHKESRQIVELYLIQMRANVLFVEHDFTFNSCMAQAKEDTRQLLKFSNLDKLAEFIWHNRNKFVEIWKPLFSQPAAAEYSGISSAIEETFILLQAA